MALLLDIVEATPTGPPRLGLLASIETIDDPNLRVGVTFVAEPCGTEGGRFDPSCGATVDVSGDKSTIPPIESYQAVGAYEPESCSTFGFNGVNVEQRAERAMSADLSKQVEKELWTGSISSVMQGGAANATNRWLARNTAGPAGFPPAVTQLNAGAAQGIVKALADLEDTIASNKSGGRSMIHCTRRTATFWFREQLLYRVGNLILTHVSDTIVVPGQGYTGSAPDGSLDATKATEWAYATGLIKARIGPVQSVIPASPELTSANRRTAVSERLFTLEIDPCVYAGVKITLTPA